MPTIFRMIALRVMLVALAVAGCAICAVLLRLGTPSEQPFQLFGADVCAPSQTVNCDYVLGSRWAKVGAVPVATLGLAYFWFLGSWFCLIGPANFPGRRWHLLPLGVASLGLCGSLFFVGVMAFALPVWCTWCVAAHIINALLFLGVVCCWPRRPKIVGDAPPEAVPVRPYPSGVHGWSVLGGVTALIAIVLLTSFAFLAQLNAGQLQRQLLRITNSIDYIEWQYRRAPRRDIPIRLDDISIGAVDAPHTAVVFSDFECAMCKAFFKSAASLEERFPGKLRFVFRHYPIDSSCNPYAPRKFHLFSCDAARAAEAVQDHVSSDRALQYHRLLYDHAANFVSRPYAALAGRIGVDDKKFATALEGDRSTTRLREDIELGHKLGVTATPAIFLDGRFLANWRIIKPGAEAQLDAGQTSALWERLLGEKARSAPTTQPD